MGRGGLVHRRGKEMKRNLIDVGQERREKYFKCSFFEQIPSINFTTILQDTMGKPCVSNNEI